jgi:hypothetical protein
MNKILCEGCGLYFPLRDIQLYYLSNTDDKQAMLCPDCGKKLKRNQLSLDRNNLLINLDELSVFGDDDTDPDRWMNLL